MLTDAFGQLAVVSKASGDVLRLQILRVLSTDSLGVLELSSVFDMRQPAMSHHLKVLSQAGLVSTRKEGNTVFYRRALPSSAGHLEGVVCSLFQAIDGITLPDNLARRFQAIRQQRSELSLAFFARNTEEFRQHQELIAEHQLYAETVADLIAATDFPERSLALELGPGEGNFLPTLAGGFKLVYALDNSEKMLGYSRQLAKQQSIGNVTFVHGEIQSLSNMTGAFDCIVINMVLHHVPSPADIFNWSSRLLKSGGSLFISELSHHDQAWVRESCGDLWLGFSAEELAQWADKAGLISGESQYLGLRNGFQIQVRRFFLSE
ncbi:metalloregulator ArsR/SmtB family transcription factor [Endozoicomonas sp. SCSIO W0465]|uniref:ArsR/SmtB family transcription factor n=1 Tax=Endozoicomonas sp. SCSIO W0465 TaxID=2918516 RepID=UPI002076585A|nr:metalloregulator ArsR/SmtB family transcription factor [Endozoicomonas sp. SCSIO W0465]USE36740.1 metalloregulator ArsR/SmtB family transcription factor [Endozoicomonas sp. SCSIO W0465]